MHCPLFSSRSRDQENCHGVSLDGWAPRVKDGEGALNEEMSVRERGARKGIHSSVK